jgi:hypothetical protein
VFIASGSFLSSGVSLNGRAGGWLPRWSNSRQGVSRFAARYFRFVSTDEIPYAMRLRLNPETIGTFGGGWFKTDLELGE